MEAVAERATLGELAEADQALAGQYAECARRLLGWVEWEEGVLGRGRAPGAQPGAPRRPGGR